MKLSRRGVMAAGLGGLVGGKEAAKSIMDGSPLKGASMFADKMEGESANVGTAIEPNMESHIAYLRKMANGQFEEWQERNLNDYSNLRERKREFEIDSLKSVSNSAKLIMADRKRKDATRREWVENAKQQLADYAKRSIFGDSKG